MALNTCEDCGGPVSDQAKACPACGRPTPVGRREGSCELCGEGEPKTGTGIHGFLEISTTLVWAVGGIIIGLALFFYLNSKPWCPQCKRRPPGTVSPLSLAALLVLGLLPAMWAVALVTGTAQ
ncbi:MAG: hypothetical protein KDD73_16135 [Anaerolineales bacterium]|nr:hypothetical protein [Anaerolineales bacterium]